MDRRSLGYGILAATLASAASAATVSFDFTGSVTAATSIAVTDVGTGLIATAYGFVNATPSLVVRSGIGYGVYQLPSIPPIGPLDFIVDGIGGTETLLVDFTPDIVTINSATFGLVQANDDVRVTVFGPGASIVSTAVFDPANGSVVTLDLTAFPTALRTGLSFGFSSVTGNDDFSVAGIEVDYTPVIPGPVVPLPPAMLAGAALMGVVAVRRARKA